MKKIAILLGLLAVLSACSLTVNFNGAADSPITYEPGDSKDADNALANAKRDGYVVHEDLSITAGQDVWDAFLAKVSAGQPCDVRLAFYYALQDASHYDPDYYEEIKNDYPVLYTQELHYDGDVFSLDWNEDDQTYTHSYPYLKLLEHTDPPASAIFTHRLMYVLVNDESVTWDQLFRAMVSSDSSVAFNPKYNHMVVYSLYTYK